MKNLKFLLGLCFMFFIASGVAFADDFFSVKSGNWSDADTWDLNAVPASSDNVMIGAGHTVTVNLPITFSGTLTCDGYLKEVAVMTKSGATFTFNNGSTYELAHAPATDAGIPTATWNAGSTCLVTGVTSATTGINANQNFHHFTWNCTGQSGGLNVGWNGNTIYGNVTVLSTGGPANAFRFTSNAFGTSSASPNIITIKGDVISSGDCFVTATGSGTPDHWIRVIIEGNLTISGTSNNFQIANGSGAYCSWHVKGNVSAACSTFTSNSTVARPDSLIFNGTGPQTLSITPSTTTHPANTHFALNNSSGVTLGANLMVTNTTAGAGSFTLINGNLNTGPYTLTIGNSASLVCTINRISGAIIGNIQRWFATGTNSNFLFPLGTVTYYRPVIISTTGVTTGDRILVVHSDGTYFTDLSPTLDDGGYSLDRRSNMYWTLTGTTIAGGTYNISVNADGQSGIIDAANVRLINSTNGSSFSLVGTHSAGSETVFNRTGISIGTFNRFYLGSKISDNPLPVQLASFIGNVVGNNAQLEWETISEINNYGFNVQRYNNNSQSYETIGFVAGKGVPSSYMYLDENASGSLEYRLEQIDNNGLSNYFGPIMLNPNSVGSDAVPAVFALNQNYPNPFNPSTTISFSLANSGYTTLKVYNLLGNEVANLFNGNAEAGKMYNVKFDASNLATGIYLYKLQSGSSVEVRKLTLVK